MRLRTILFGVAILLASFAGATVLMPLLGPSSSPRPALVEIPPLKAVSRTSTIVTPVAVALSAIRDALDAQAPHNLSGKRDNPISQVLSNADIGWSISRSPLQVMGRSDALLLGTVITGSLRATGQIAATAGNLTGALGGIVDQNLGRGLQAITGKTLDQRTDIRGNITLTSHPALQPNWRLDPNLSAQISIADAAMSIAGIKIAVGNEVKPLLERQVAEQVGALQARVRNDPILEATARREWAKMCRSVSLGQAGPGAPNLWMEVRPTRAFAGQPKIDANAVTLLIGVQAETRVVPNETKPDCPFPAKLDIVPQTDTGGVALAVPIDVPFTEVNRLLDLQLAGKTFPQDGSGAYEATVRKASLAASGDRLLISLRVKAREKTSWFGLGAEANVFVWGRPVLDADQQILRLTDITLDVDSESAFGLLGAAAKAAIPYLKDALAENAKIDLKPFAANARASIEKTLADYRAAGDSTRVEANVTDLRLLDIAFDSQTLRVIAQANGTVNVTVNALPQ